MIQLFWNLQVYQARKRVWQQINYNTCNTYGCDKIVVFKHKVEPHCHACNLVQTDVKCLKDYNCCHALLSEMSSLQLNACIAQSHKHPRMKHCQRRKNLQSADIPWLLQRLTRIPIPEDQEQHISPDCTPDGKSIWHCKSTESEIKISRSLSGKYLKKIQNNRSIFQIENFPSYKICCQL